ncbi:uncharacterized protein LOC110446124 [Mizuhopecten yessoensis]|uniref:Fanconi anemia-associated protein 100 n=1 Tax=Mizuhopecten yessoensis TaxID=6573 RepID=A0A210QY38_MIZYE|nr:uncharacterized protein LOC110446124 [Mizuhopecten yessoensis]OWF53659.1 Fanconi anemia-associated protein 100 [Mizuhopecten yessoensis]
MKVVRDVNTDEIVSATLDKAKTRLHIYRQCQLQGIVAVPELVLDMCVGHHELNDSKNAGWVLYILTKCHLYAVFESQVLTNKASKSVPQTETRRGNQEIFSELLGKDSIFGAKEFDPVSQPVYQATGDHSLIEVGQEVVGLAVGCGIVTIASCCQDHYLIQLYPLGELHAENHKTPLQTYVILRHLPVSCSDLTSNHQYFTHSGDGQEFPPLHSSEDMSVSLHLVMSSDGNPDQQNFSSILDISNDFFQALCGFELSLLNSPLLLICPPEGSIYYAPIKSLDTTNRNVKLFCHTHYAVVGVGKIDLKVTDTSEPPGLEVGIQDRHTGLIVTSQDGRALLATSSLGKPQKLEFIEFALPGPVQDVDTHGSKMYHSTGMDVFETLLETSPEPTGLSSHTEGLMYAGVQELACLHNYNHTQGGACDLMLVTPGLSLKVINPALRRQRGRLARGTGQTIRDLLHSINMCSQETEALTQQQSHQTGMLAQLNMAAFLSTQDPHSPDFPLHFSYSVAHVCTRLQQSNEWVFSCHMTNMSEMHLSSDWMVTVILSDDKQEFMHSSFPIPHELGLGAGVEFRMVPPASHHSLLRPVEVKTSLLLQSTNNTRSLPVMSVLVSTTTLDILYGLVTPEDVTTVTSRTQEVSMTQLVREMAATRPIFQCVESLPTPTPATIKIHVPNNVLESDQLSVYCKETCPLLSYLLHSSSVSPRNGSVSMVTVGGQKLELTIEGETLTIQSDRAVVAIAARHAILNRLRDCVSRGTRPLHHNDRPAQQQFNSVQLLENRLSDLHSWSSTTDIYKNRNQVLDMYTNLRSTPAIEKYRPDAQ